MTKLRDDGYLETDDPVVAACFLGYEAKTGYSLTTVRSDGWDSWSEAEQARYGSAYPIRIPAETFKSVWRSDDAIREFLYQRIRARSIDVLDWFRTHTQEGE